jgi:hypothetical protein
MKDLIEKLEDTRDYIKGRTQSINIALKFEEIEFLLQALTSVKSEPDISDEKFSLEKAKEYTLEKFNMTKLEQKHPFGGVLSNNSMRRLINASVEVGYKFAIKSKSIKDVKNVKGESAEENYGEKIRNMVREAELKLKK